MNRDSSLVLDHLLEMAIGNKELMSSERVKSDFPKLKISS